MALLRLNPSGAQFSVAHGTDVEELARDLEEALAIGGSVRVRYELSDLPDVTGEVFLNAAAVESVELAELPDDADVATRGLRPSGWPTLAEQEVPAGRVRRWVARARRLGRR